MTNLYDNPQNYVKNILIDVEGDYKRYKAIFVTLNILIAIFTALSTIITAIIISKLVFSTFPEWYFFATAGLSAFSALFGSIVNYFNISDKIKDFKKQRNDIQIEQIKFENNISEAYSGPDKEYRLYLRVSAIVGNESSQVEVKYD